jgi:GH24 family phage-related lysozyme (muramidase)
MQITTRTALEVAHHEGVVRQAYRDSVGVWTWGFGLTDASGHSVGRYKDNPVPMEKCVEIWLWVLEKYAKDVRDAFRGHDLTEAQFAAALSFHWNTGSIHKATWVKQWKAGDTVAARASIMNWRKPAEIIPRRKAERDLFFYGKWSGSGKVTEYTRLHRTYTPDWSSAVRVDIREQVDSLLGNRAPVEAPQASPAPWVEERPIPGFWARLWALLTGGKA